MGVLPVENLYNTGPWLKKSGQRFDNINQILVAIVWQSSSRTRQDEDSSLLNLRTIQGEYQQGGLACSTDT